MRLAAPQVLVRELPERRGLLLALDVVCGIVARSDAGEHSTGAPAGFGKLHLAMAGDDDAAAPSLDAGLHDPDLPARGVDAQPEAGQRPIEQERVLGLGLALVGEARGEVNGGHGGLLLHHPQTALRGAEDAADAGTATQVALGLSGNQDFFSRGPGCVGDTTGSNGSGEIQLRNTHPLPTTADFAVS